MTIYELKMSRFIDYLFSEDQPDWFATVYEEYVSLRENENSRYVLGIMKDIFFLRNKKMITDRILDVLPLMASSSLITELKLMGYKGRFNPDNPKQYQQDIKAAKSASKRIISQITIKEKELTDYNEKYGQNELKRQDFEDLATNYSKFLGSMIDLETITVARWCSVAKKYDAYCEVQNAQTNNLINQKGYG